MILPWAFFLPQARTEFLCSKHSGNACWIDFLMYHTRKQKARHLRFFWNERNNLDKGYKKEEGFFTSTNLDLDVSPTLISHQRPWDLVGEMLGSSLQMHVYVSVQHINFGLWIESFANPTHDPKSLTSSPTQLFCFSRRKKVSMPSLWLENRGRRWWRQLKKESRVCTLLALISS